MAKPLSRKSSKKCPRGKVVRRSHVRMGRKVKTTCVRRTRRTVDRSRVVAMFYPDRAPVTMGDLMNMYSKTRFLNAVNDPIEPSRRAELGFRADQTFTEIVDRLMTFGDATIDVTPDKRPLPEGQSRIVFMTV
jgi:hypothetical protein